MSVYRYNHEWCGFEQDLFLENTVKQNIIMPCYRCGRDVTARKINDKSADIRRSGDGTVGVIRHEQKSKRRRGRN